MNSLHMISTTKKTEAKAFFPDAYVSSNKRFHRALVSKHLTLIVRVLAKYAVTFITFLDNLIYFGANWRSFIAGHINRIAASFC